MAPTETLKKWVNAENLDDAAVAEYRHRFEKHPARLLVIDDFLVDSVADRLATFLEREAQFQVTYGARPGKKVSREEWERLPERERFYRYGQLQKIRDEFQLSPNSMAYVTLRRDFLQSDFFARYFGDITGLTLRPGDDFSLHRMTSGDFLLSHSDVLGDRRLAFVLHFSRDWRPEWGGALRIADPGGHTHLIGAGYNKVVMFDVKAGTEHDVEPISDAAGDRARLSMGGWFREAGD